MRKVIVGLCIMLCISSVYSMDIESSDSNATDENSHTILEQNGAGNPEFSEEDIKRLSVSAHLIREPKSVRIDQEHDVIYYIYETDDTEDQYEMKNNSQETK